MYMPRVLVGCLICGSAATAAAQTPLSTGFTYEGRLREGPAGLRQLSDGSVDVRVGLWNVESGGTVGTNRLGQVESLNVSVSFGLLSVFLDFGVDVFNNEERWLEFEVRSPAGVGTYETLAPRQRVTPVPYALQTRGVFVQSDGAVGIGTTVPNAPLAISSSPGVDAPMLRLHKTGPTAFGEYAGIAFRVANELGQLGAFDTTMISDVLEAANNRHGLGFWTRQDAGTSAERVRIDGVGNVGIGRTPTTNLLEVEGEASKSIAGNWAANSDARIKKDVESLTGALDVINRVHPVSFRYTDDYRAAHPSIRDHCYYNVIAQEFRDVFPDSVKESNDQGHLLQVDTYPMTVYSVAAIQELHAKVTTLELDNAALRAQMESLRQQVQMLVEERSTPTGPRQIAVAEGAGK